MKIKLIYTDGTFIIRQFASKEEADWFIHNEGDHLLETQEIGDETEIR